VSPSDPLLHLIDFVILSLVPWSYSHVSSNNDDGLVWNNTIVPGLVPNSSDTLATHGGINANANPTVKMLPPFVQTLFNQVQGQQQGSGGQRQFPGVPTTFKNINSAFRFLMSSTNSDPNRVP
jgi:hypothetical protein